MRLIDRYWFTWLLVPIWLALPLMFLGGVLLIFFPIGFDWFDYGSSLVLALTPGGSGYSGAFDIALQV